MKDLWKVSKMLSNLLKSNKTYEISREYSGVFWFFENISEYSNEEKERKKCPYFAYVQKKKILGLYNAK